MDPLLSLLSNIKTNRFEEDIIDRINYKYTAYIFAFGTFIISYKQYLGSAITCWTPAEFRRGWNEYARDYCLIENTYYVPLNDPNLPNVTYREKEELPYYQWVQFVLILLAFCFYVPHLIWRSVNWWSGIQVRSIIISAARLSQYDEEKRQKDITKIADIIHRAINRQKMHGDNRLMGSGWLSLQYIIMKILFIINIVIQILILHLFLGFNWGDLYALKLGFNTEWKATGLFPRSTMCDFEIRNKGNVQRYSVQCVLSLNMFNEKIFTIIFYWLMVLFFATVINLGLWLIHIYSPRQRLLFARRILDSAEITRTKSNEQNSPTTKDSMEMKKLIDSETRSRQDMDNTYTEFVAMNPDLVVLLRLISSCAGVSVTSEIVRALLDKFRRNILEMVYGLVTMERVATFSAAHRLHSKQLSDEENAKIYGKCNNINSHGHNYVKLRGQVDAVTGMLYDLADLKKDMEAVMDTVDHKNLDKDVVWFKDRTSTSENVSIYLWEALSSRMRKPELLYKVTVEETPKNIFTYKGGYSH